MPMSVRTLVGANFNNPRLPIRGPDALLTGGTVHMFDAANVGSNSGAPSAQGTFTEIGSLNSGRTIAGAAPAIDGGGLYNAGTTNWGISCDEGVDLAARAGREFLVACWLKVTTNQNGNVSQVFRYGEKALGGSTGRTSAKHHIGLEMRSYVLFLYFHGVERQIATLAVATRYQIVMHIKPNTTTGVVTVDVYVNGVFVNSVTMAYVAPSALTQPFWAASAGGADPGTDRVRFHGWFYRSWIEDLTASGRDPAYWVARDYALNTARFS